MSIKNIFKLKSDYRPAGDPGTTILSGLATGQDSFHMFV